MMETEDVIRSRSRGRSQNPSEETSIVENYNQFNALIASPESTITNTETKEKDADLNKETIENEDDDSTVLNTEFQCNICFDTACDPVITRCGHLYCWPCLYQWLTSRNSSRNTCPVCKSFVERSQLIPIYTNGRKTNPADTIPSRPLVEQQPATRTTRPDFSSFFTSAFGTQVNGEVRFFSMAERGRNSETSDFIVKLFSMLAIMLFFTILLG